MFIPIEDEFVKVITVKRICPNIQLLLLLKAWRFKKPLRNRSGPQGQSNQSSGGLRRECRMEDGSGRAGNMVYVQGWVVGMVGVVVVGVLWRMTPRQINPH